MALDCDEEAAAPRPLPVAVVAVAFDAVPAVAHAFVGNVRGEYVELLAASAELQIPLLTSSASVILSAENRCRSAKVRKPTEQILLATGRVIA